MARIRQIKPEFYLDDELARCSIRARFMFPGLWCLADRAGRLEDRPARIKAQIFPYDDNITVEDVEVLLDSLAEHFILRYSVAGKHYIQIRNFARHQHIHIKESPSQIPPPEGGMMIPDEPESKTGQQPVKNRSSRLGCTSTSGYMDKGAGVGMGTCKTGVSTSQKSHQLTPATAFVLTDELRSWAEEKAPNVDPEIEAEKFRSHYGRDGRTFPDMEKAWHNWIFKAIEWQARARAPADRRESRAERNERICREIEAEDAKRAFSVKHGG
jgi:hypothetical protein